MRGLGFANRAQRPEGKCEVGAQLAARLGREGWPPHLLGRITSLNNLGMGKFVWGVVVVAGFVFVGALWVLVHFISKIW